MKAATERSFVKLMPCIVMLHVLVFLCMGWGS